MRVMCIHCLKLQLLHQCGEASGSTKVRWFGSFTLCCTWVMRPRRLMEVGSGFGDFREVLLNKVDAVSRDKARSSCCLRTLPRMMFRRTWCDSHESCRHKKQSQRFDRFPPQESSESGSGPSQNVASSKSNSEINAFAPVVECSLSLKPDAIPVEERDGA